MQPARKADRSELQAAIALILLTLGTEAFLRFSTYGPYKLSAVVAVVVGVTLLGWPQRRRRALVLKAVVAVGFVAYMIEATWRFPGLLKSPQPYAVSELVVYNLEVLILLTLASALCGVIVYLVRFFIARVDRGSGER